MLYRGVYLGYDPYDIHNIDEKGKSYLKVRYNIKNPYLVSMRQQHTQYIIDKSMNEEVVNPIRHRLRAILRGIYLDFFSFIFFIYIRCKMKYLYGDIHSIISIICNFIY